jgi:hypothetical protein
MTRTFASSLLFLSAVAQPLSAREISIVSETELGRSTTTIVQTTPGEKSLEFDVKSGPGYVIIRQRDKNGGAVVIQGVGASGGTEER